MQKVSNEDENIAMALEVGKLLPETNDKVDHYKEILRAEGDLLNYLEKRQGKFYVRKVKKIREKVEISDLKNSILNKQKIFESYLARKKSYEAWLDEVSVEVNSNFDKVLEKSKSINNNLRLKHALESFEKREDIPSLQEKVEFYFYLKKEISNNEKYGKK